MSDQAMGSEFGLPIVCPFCPLHCDDVLIESPPDCWILNDALARLNSGDCEARIGDRAATLDQAEQAARRRIREAKSVTLRVRRATIGQAKAIVESGFTILTEASPTFEAVQTAIARCGVIAATMADIKQHADTLVILGDIDLTAPRLKPKLKGPAPVPEFEAQTIASPTAESIANLAADIRQGKQLASSSYVAFLLDSETFGEEEAEPSVELLIETIIWMNSTRRETKQRAVLFTLDPLASLRCVSAWSGECRSVLRTDSEYAESERSASNPHERFRLGEPSDNPTAAQPGEAWDLTIRIGEPTSAQRPADIQIGGVDHGLQQAAIYLPAATPGIHHADAVIRGDGTVTLPLKKVTASLSPSVAEWIARLS